MEEKIQYVLSPDAANTFQEWEKNLGSEIGQTRKPKNGKGVGSTKVMYIKKIGVEKLPTDGVMDSDVTAADKYEIQICTNSQSGIIGIGDKDCFWKLKEGVPATITPATATYEGILHNKPIAWFDVNLPYVKNENGQTFRMLIGVFIGIDSDGLADADTHLVIVYEYKYVNNFVMSRMLKALT